MAALMGPVTAAASAVYQPLPFNQNWNNTTLLTANDNWSGVPGIVGYLGEDPITSEAGRLPRTITADSSSAVDLIANQTNPNTLVAGGVAEFHLVDPVVALQGSATADYPHLVIHLNTIGVFGPLIFQARLRDIDGSLDNATQPIQVQYRTQPSGEWTNAAGGDFLDATTGPGMSTLETAVYVVLPGDVGNRPQLQIRILTANAAGGPLGNDEWVGIDDISVSPATSGVPAPGSLQPTTWSRIKSLGR
ncbi:MAG: hypothetical protein SGI90_02515 [Candidatus Eisenbacteria bacterium]|nr:hypothetical protein [Candidatus Eisenbacteria bacterium]